MLFCFPSLKTDVFLAYLYNDEVHSYDEVNHSLDLLIIIKIL